MIWILLVLAVALVFMAFTFMNMRGVEEPSPEPQEDVDDPGYSAELVKLNLDVRLKWIDDGVRGLCEEIIDKLVELEPFINDKLSPAGELRYTINRIATEYLPAKCMRPFLQLDDGTRNDPGVIANQKESLQALLAELIAVEESMQSKDKREYDIKSDFLKAKFNLEG